MLILPLAEPPGQPAYDRVLAGVIGLAETIAPGQVHSYYLTGSYVRGDAVPTSDLDLVVLLRPGLPAARVAGLRDVFRCAGTVSPVPIDALLGEIGRLSPLTARELPESRLLYGTDLRPTLSPPDAEGVLWATLCEAHTAIGRVLGQQRPVRLPAGPPEPADPWLGLVRRPVRQPDGSERPGLREAVTAVVWAAKAELLRRAGRWVPGKAEPLVHAYRQWVGPPWDGLVETACLVCRREWAYRVPDGSGEQAALREFCRNLVIFCDDFLRDYWQFWERIAASQDVPTAQRAWAAERCGDVIRLGGRETTRRPLIESCGELRSMGGMTRSIPVTA